MSYVYIQTERSGQKISEGNYFEHDLFTVGFYDPKGMFQAESDWPNRERAAERVNYLNGGKGGFFE
jgi:hypothetical protein